MGVIWIDPGRADIIDHEELGHRPELQAFLETFEVSAMLQQAADSFC
jgi:hypothetical protein